MFKKISVLSVVLFFSLIISGISFLYSQQIPDESLSASAEIKSIETKGFGKKKHIIATVAFKTVEGSLITTNVELAAIPYIGTLSKVGDKIDISYNKKTPAIAFTKTGNFLNQYGLYILIGLGFVFSIPVVLRQLKKKS